jgi:NADH-quinone oxidoreductase subunit C
VDIRDIQLLLHERFGSVVSPVESARLFEFIEVDPMTIAEVGTFLRDTPGLEFDCLANLSGCDRPARAKIQIVYELHSYALGHRLVVKADARRDAPRVATVENVWPAAGWLEREVYDLLGVDFVGHSDLRRLLLPDDWVGHPLRKDYVEASHYHGIATVRESPLSLPGLSGTLPPPERR